MVSLWWTESASPQEKIHRRQSLDAFGYNEVQTGLRGLMAILTEGTGGTGGRVPTPPGLHSRFLIMIKQLCWHSTSVSAYTFVFRFLWPSLPPVPQLRNGFGFGSRLVSTSHRRRRGEEEMQETCRKARQLTCGAGDRREIFYYYYFLFFSFWRTSGMERKKKCSQISIRRGESDEFGKRIWNADWK